MTIAPLTSQAKTSEPDVTLAGWITDEDREILVLLAQGLQLDAIARELFVSGRTLRRRTRTLCDKLGVSTCIEAVVWAARNKLI